MIKSIFSIFSAAASVALLIFMMGCAASGDSDDLVKAVTLEAQLSDGTLVSSLEIQGSGVRIRAGETFQLKALGTDLNGDVSDVSDKVEWSSADTSVLSVNQTGLVTGIANKTDAQGFVEITILALGNATATGTISVNDAEISNVQVIRSATESNEVYACVDAQFEASITYVDGVNHTVTERANWLLTGSNTATIENNGLLHTSSSDAEALTIGAELDGVSGQLVQTTDPSELNTVFTFDQDTQINSLSLQIGQRLQLDAKAAFNAGIITGIVEINHDADWQSNNKAVAGITNLGNNKGSLLAVKTGDTTISAQCSGVSGLVTVSVLGNDVIELLTINPQEEILEVKQGDFIDLQMLVTYSGESNAINITEFVNWDIENADLVRSQLSNNGTADSAFRINAEPDVLGDAIVRAFFDGETRLVTIRIVD